MSWLVAVAGAFLIAHIVALTIWGRASASEPTVAGQAAISSWRD
jgi:hypothetical protein